MARALKFRSSREWKPRRASKRPHRLKRWKSIGRPRPRSGIRRPNFCKQNSPARNDLGAFASKEVVSKYLDLMRRDPNVDLVKSLFKNFLDIPHLLPILGNVGEIEPHSNQAIVADSALIEPVAADNYCISTRSAKGSDTFIIRCEILFENWQKMRDIKEV